jgi:hypothetical protein
MPVKGQTRYEFWKTRLMKRSTNIEIEKPTAADHRLAARRWLQSSHAVIGSHTSTASGTNG